jgi:hypothetical protein
VGLHITLRAVVILIVLGLGVVLPHPLVRADDTIRVLNRFHEVHFAESIDFGLEVEARHALAQAVLYYRQVGEGVTIKVPIAIASTEQRLFYTWEIEPGDVPVGARIEYEWLIVDALGNQLRTLPAILEYEDDRFDWQTAGADGIRIFWYDASEEEARQLLAYATESLERLQDEMGVTLEQPVQIYVYRTKSDMAAALPRTSEAYDDRILTLGVVVDDATLLLLGSHPDVEGTIAHELSHIVVGLATDNPYASLPRWLDEGLAMYAEGELPSGNRRALERAIRNDQLISVRSLSGYTGDPSQVDLFYGQVYSVVEYLLQTHGKDQMSELLDAVREGLYQEDALQRVYGFGLDELDAQWRESLGLSPRGVSTVEAPDVTRPERRTCVPCPGALLGMLLGGVALVLRRNCA